MKRDEPAPRFRATARHGFALACALALLARTAPAQASTPAFVRGESAFLAADANGAERAFREVLATDTVAVHQVDAIRILASIAWRLRRDSGAASALLARGESIPRARPAMLLERARMQYAMHDFAAAGETAAAARRESASALDSMTATALLVESMIEPRMAALIDSRVQDTSRNQALRVAVRVLREMVSSNPGQPRLARSLLNAAVLLGDGPAMREAWGSYYLIGTGDSSRGILHDARRALDAILPTWTGKTTSASDRTSLVRALADSRFFDASVAVALTSGGSEGHSDPRTNELQHYARFLRGMEQITNEYYRQMELGKRDTTEWKASYSSLGAALWPSLRWTGATPVLGAARFAAEVDARFGAYVNFGITAGYADLHYGHRVVDERRRITQYGRSADLRFVALDAMVSDGFQTWAWDGRAGHGGWATKDLIVQVRPNYAEGTLDAWSLIADSTRHALRDAEIVADSISDFARARTTPVAYFPSVAARMQRSAQMELLDSLRSAGFTGAQLEARFERIYGDAIQESSIFVHEGRHAIDKLKGAVRESADLEYFAKLSELAFSPRPRLMLPGIMLANLGDRTPHGQANERIMRGLLKWMEAHPGEIRNLDVDAPLLPQLPLLTDAQLRAAARALDPLARPR